MHLSHLLAHTSQGRKTGKLLSDARNYGFEDKAKEKEKRKKKKKKKKRIKATRYYKMKKKQM